MGTAGQRHSLHVVTRGLRSLDLRRDVYFVSHRVRDFKYEHTKDDEAAEHDEVFNFFRRAVFGNEQTFDAVGKMHDSTS